MKADCQAMRERLLNAELHELRGEGNTELARHLGRCAGCMALAQSILDSQGALDRSLAAMRTERAVDTVLERVRASERPSRLRVSWRWAVPAAAAAAVLGLLLARPSQFETASPDAWTPTRGDRWLDTEFAEAPSSRTMLVFETKDRSAKVIWFYGSEE